MSVLVLHLHDKFHIREGFTNYFTEFSMDGYLQPDVEIVGQPVSEADRKFLTVQKVLEASSFL